MSLPTSRHVDLTRLIRPEALQGKAYARLANPPLIANVALARPVAVALGCAGLLFLLLSLLPVKTSYRATGAVALASTTSPVRAPRAGQLMRIGMPGDRIARAESVAFLEQPIQSDDGRDPAAPTRKSLAQLANDQNQDLRLLSERFELAHQQLLERDRTLAMLRASNTDAIRHTQALAEQAQRLSDKLSSDAAGYVTRIDALALAERTVTAHNHLIDLQTEQVRLQAEQRDVARSRRILAIDRQRELDEVRRKYLTQEAALLDRSGNQRFSVPAPVDGQVLAVFRRLGDWVAAGDDLLLIGPGGSEPGPAHLTVPIPGDLANLLAVGQQAWVWANPKRPNEAPLPARVISVDPLGADTETTSARQSAASPFARAYVARVALDRGESLLHSGLAEVRPGSKVDVEIIFGSQPLYEALLPKRLSRPERLAGTASRS